QHVVFAIVESRHDVFQNFGTHLAMGNGDAHFWHSLVEKTFGLGEVLDVRADIKGLATAIVLAQQRFAHDQRIEWRNEGAHRKAVDWWRGNDGKLPHPRQRQLKRPWDRGCRQREHMNLSPQLFELLLVSDAEVLFLVNHHEAEILKVNRLAEERVGANDD